MRFALGALACLVVACGARTGVRAPATRDAGLSADAFAARDAPSRDAPATIDAFVVVDAAPSLDAGTCGVPNALPTRLWAIQSGMRTTTRRTDLHVDTTMWEPIPTVIVETTVLVSREGGARHLVLAGDASGTGSWDIDNFALFEIFDCEGRRIAVAFAGFTNGEVTLDGIAVDQLSTNDFAHRGGEITLDALVPSTGVFTLHATALDYGGWEAVSDLYLVSR